MTGCQSERFPPLSVSFQTHVFLMETKDLDRTDDGQAMDGCGLFLTQKGSARSVLYSAIVHPGGHLPEPIDMVSKLQDPLHRCDTHRSSEVSALRQHRLRLMEV